MPDPAFGKIDTTTLSLNRDLSPERRAVEGRSTYTLLPGTRLPRVFSSCTEYTVLRQKVTQPSLLELNRCEQLEQVRSILLYQNLHDPPHRRPSDTDLLLLLWTEPGPCRQAEERGAQETKSQEQLACDVSIAEQGILRGEERAASGRQVSPSVNRGRKHAHLPVESKPQPTPRSERRGKRVDQNHPSRRTKHAKITHPVREHTGESLTPPSTSGATLVI